MDYSAEKIETSDSVFEEINFELEKIYNNVDEDVYSPLRGILNGLIVSVPIWIVGFLIFKLI